MSAILSALNELGGFALFATLSIAGAWLSGLAVDVFRSMSRKR